MAIKLANNKFQCPICGKIFPESITCDLHRDKEHDIVYVAMSRSDLNRLSMFIRLKDDKLLTESLVKTIMSFASKSAITQITNDNTKNNKNS